MNEDLNNQALQVATKRLEQARKLLEQNFDGELATDLPELILSCAQLLAIEYNSLMVEKAARQSATELKSFLANDF